MVEQLIPEGKNLVPQPPARNANNIPNQKFENMYNFCMLTAIQNLYKIANILKVSYTIIDLPGIRILRFSNS